MVCFKGIPGFIPNTLGHSLLSTSKVSTTSSFIASRQRSKTKKRRNLCMWQFRHDVQAVGRHPSNKKYEQKSQQSPQAMQSLATFVSLCYVPKAELRDPQVEDLHHGELVVHPGELATRRAHILQTTWKGAVAFCDWRHNHPSGLG